MAARTAVKQGISRTVPAWLIPIKRWCYSKSYFPSIGLMIDDCLYEDKYVKEAIRRLPQKVREERDFRISRALLLSTNKETLPKEEWTRWDDDVKYLSPIIEDVKIEFRERDDWDSK